MYPRYLNSQLGRVEAITAETWDYLITSEYRERSIRPVTENPNSVRVSVQIPDFGPTKLDGSMEDYNERDSAVLQLSGPDESATGFVSLLYKQLWVRGRLRGD